MSPLATTQIALASPGFVTFAIASLALALTPGPAVIFLITQSLAHGRRAGLASVVGIALGNLGCAAAAGLGLAALMAASATAFAIIKLFGAAYLIFLGLRALRGAATTCADAGAAMPAACSLGTMFRDAFLVALLNPKTALFFAALLPQFLNPHAPPLAQSLVLGGIFVTIAMGTDTLYVLCASALASTLRRRTWRPYGRYVSAASFLGLGVFAAITGPRKH